MREVSTASRVRLNVFDVRRVGMPLVFTGSRLKMRSSGNWVGGWGVGLELVTYSNSIEKVFGGCTTIRF